MKNARPQARDNQERTENPLCNMRGLRRKKILKPKSADSRLRQNQHENKRPMWRGGTNHFRISGANPSRQTFCRNESRGRKRISWVRTFGKKRVLARGRG